MTDADMTMREWPANGPARQVEGVQAIRDRIHEGNCARWVDVLTDKEDTLRAFADRLGLDDQIVDYTFEPMERPKLTFSHGETLFVVYATLDGRVVGEDVAAGDAPEDVDDTFVRVSGVVKGDLVVTVRSDARLDIEALMEDVDVDEDAPLEDADAVDTNRVLYTILDGMVDTHFEAIQRLDRQIDGLEEQLFATERLPKDFARDAYLVRKQIAHLRQVVLPMREVAVGLERHRVAF